MRMSDLDPDDIVSTDQVAKIADVDKRTVQRWCESGELKSRRLGRNYVIIWKDAQEFLAQRGK